MGDSVVMLSLYPEFPPSVTPSCGEFLFLVDRSGSMDVPLDSGEQRQTRIGSAKAFRSRLTIVS